MSGERKSAKIFGCVELNSASFTYHRAAVFNADTYLDFLEQIARRYYPKQVIFIQDNASYHKEQDVSSWFEANSSWWQKYDLPPYSPEFNATERLWHHTRMNGTHNRYFASLDELRHTLTSIFRSIQRDPDQIRGYLQPFT